MKPCPVFEITLPLSRVSVLSCNDLFPSVHLRRNGLQETRLPSFGFPHEAGIHASLKKPTNRGELQRHSELFFEIQSKTKDTLVQKQNRDN